MHPPCVGPWFTSLDCPYKAIFHDMQARAHHSLTPIPTCPPHLVCSKKECPKNHIEHFTIEEEGEDGSTHTIKGATMHLPHHKVNYGVGGVWWCHKGNGCTWLRNGER